MRFTAHVQQRWSDLDAQGHVNNVVVADYLQQARSQFMEAGGPDTAALFSDGVVVVSHSILYHRALRHADVVDIELWVAELGAARLRIDYRIVQDGQQAITASSVLCPFDFQEQRPRRLLEGEREFFVAHRDEALSIDPMDGPVLGGRGLPTRIDPRWSDVDRFGHVNNVRALEWVMEARIRTTSSLDASMARTGTGDGSELRWLIARQDIDYLAQMTVRPEPYVVVTAPIHLGTTSVVLGAEIIDPETSTTFVAARAVLVCAEADGAKRPLPESAREALAKALVSA